MMYDSLLSYSWGSQCMEAQQQLSQQQDEVISVYEIYVKEETVSSERQGGVSVLAGDPCTSNRMIQVAEKKANEVTPNNIRLIDKDDPRSRLHFVKYLKRDGKTLKIWECGICSKEFRHQYTLMRHLPTHTDERNFKCDTCGKAFRQLSTLSQHRAIHSDARPYICEFCKKTFNRVSTLISHRKTHSEEKPHKCHMCGKGFHQKGNLRNHVFTHTNERPYKCEQCEKGFNQMSNLMCHKVKAHAQTERSQYVCGICGKEFPRRFSLRSHEEYKHGIKYCQSNSAAVQGANDLAAMRNKNVRIVHLPNGDRTLLSDPSDKDLQNRTGQRARSVLVDKIETKAMETAISQGQTPFALFKPAKGIPVLVKVSSAPANERKQMLTPATAEDLRVAGQMSLNPTLSGDVDGVKAVQIKVPVVATVTEKIDDDNNFSFVIEPPGPDQEQGTTMDSQFPYPEQSEQWSSNSRQHQPSSSDISKDCDLFTLAAQGGIQFVRATDDGRFEVMSNIEARDLMAQNSHDVTILNDEDAISVVNFGNNPRSISENNGVILGEESSRITVLNSGNARENIDIEMLEDKDIQILGGEALDDRFEDDITILDHTKIDDMILGPKAFNVGGNVTLLGQENVTNSRQNSLLLKGTRNAMSMTSPLNRSQSGFDQSLHDFDRGQDLSEEMTFLECNDAAEEHLTILMDRSRRESSSTDENLSIFGQTESLQDGITILGSNGAIRSQNFSIFDLQNHDLDSKAKDSEFDIGSPDLGLMPINQQIKILGSKNDDIKILG